MGEQLYFSIGEAIAILSITLAIPQYARPVVLFRLRAQRLRLSWLYVAVFIGCICTVVAAVVPRMTWLPRSLQWPLIWELLASAVFITVFALFSIAFLRPPRARNGGYPQYVVEAAAFLAHADEKDQAEFSKDLRANIVEIIRASSFGSHHSEISAFYAFTHRKKLADAGYAASFLRLIAEPQFCSVLVSRTPWDVAAMLNQLTREKIHSHAAQEFIQEIARQAIIAPNSMFGREVDYKGFHVAPALSEAIFSSDFLRRHYEPLSFFGYGDFDTADPERLSRLRHAVNLQLSQALEQQVYWSDRTLSRLPDFLRSALWRIRKLASTDERAWGPAHEITRCLTDTIDSIRKALLTLRESDKGHDRERYNMLFLREAEDPWRAGLLNDAAETISESLFAISNDFSDHNDVFWHLALDVTRHAVPEDGGTPNGLDPFQQRVLLKLISKIKVNMTGYYPAVSRVLLAVLSPLKEQADVNQESAYMLLKKALYHELRQFPALYENDQKKALDKLPRNARFDPATGTLYRLYRSGEDDGTNLRDLQIPEISFFDEKYWLKAS